MTQLVMGSILLPIFVAVCKGDTSKAWRSVSVVPAVVGFITGVVVFRISDDSPKGNYSELKAKGVFPPVTAWSSLWKGSWNWNTWLLAFQYACCFGVEL